MEGIKETVAPDDRQKEGKELPADGHGQTQKGCKSCHQDSAFFHHPEIHIAASGPKGAEECNEFLFINVHLFSLLTGSVWGRNPDNPPPPVHSQCRIVPPETLWHGSSPHGDVRKPLFQWGIL